ncbi:TonB-dependent receptor [Ramlibacter sp. AN1015]|uniref:TonB-dependent receptor plug domain-containing protein n=1 Tax=Ramlibacter sp. AN1015 TaxID=3133428 RepID=UPI0030C456C3
MRRLPGGLISVIVAAPLSVWGGEHTALRQLADLSLEQLAEVRVTSVSGRAERLQEAPASVYVITATDIRRSAATSLPEVLRLAPNLQVAQVNAGIWAISARGGNTAIANKLLVLLDGRTLYSTLFAGVIWDMHDVVLEDIERIEVVSGPGGTLWGANAVNGVINIVTRSAAQTHGALVSVLRSHSGGREALRWGGTVGPAHVRVWGLATDNGATTRLDGTDREDARSRRQVGFRADWTGTSGHLTLIGDLARAGDGEATRDAPNHHNGSLLARWAGRLGDGSAYSLQGYTALAERDERIALNNRSRVHDLEFRHEPRLATGGKLLWGFGARQADDINTPTQLVALEPADRTLRWAHLFVQHQRALSARLTLTAGVKAERNSYTGLEWLPNLRLAWRHEPDQTSWAAVSRAVRAPSRIDRDLRLPGSPPYFIAGGPNFRSEVATVLEVGHHGRVRDGLTWSATLFHQRYDGLRAGIPGQLPATVENLVDGYVQGVEAWSRWQMTRDWRLEAGGLVQRKRLRHPLEPGRTVFPDLGNDPRSQWTLRSRHDLPRRVELDLALRRVGSLPAPAVPAYTALDLRLARQVSPTLRLALLGQNLLDARHVEFPLDATESPSQIGRRLAFQIVWTP